MDKTKGFKLYWIWIAAAILLLLFYFNFDPSTTKFMPQCIFYRLTGYQCMGCGSQRMIHSLLHGDFMGAFRANALLFCCLPIIMFLTFAELSRNRYPKLYLCVHQRWVIITLAAILFIWLPVRNMIGV